MNLAQVADSITGHCRSDSPSAPLNLSLVQRPVLRLRKSTVGCSNGMKRNVLVFLSQQEKGATRPQMNKVLGLPSAIGSAVAQCCEDGTVSRTGTTRKYLYLITNAGREAIK